MPRFCVKTILLTEKSVDFKDFMKKIFERKINLGTRGI